MITRGLIEVILYVEDMNAQVAFYRDILGLKLFFPSMVSDFKDEMWVTFDTGACTLALHGGGKRRLGKDTPKIVFGVEDIHAAREFYIQRGLALGAVRTAAPGIYVCDGIDLEGNPFSLESHQE